MLSSSPRSSSLFSFTRVVSAQHLVSPCPGRKQGFDVESSARLCSSAATQFLLVFGSVGGGHVLEEFLDEVDVSEDHAATAVALEAYGVEGFAGMGKNVLATTDREAVSFGGGIGGTLVWLGNRVWRPSVGRATVRGLGKGEVTLLPFRSRK